jgi:putative ABC transport system substrate-binding protein
VIARRWLLGGLIASPWLAAAQSPGKRYRIGVIVGQLTTAEVNGPQTRSPGVNALLRGLRDLGWLYGEHFVTAARSSEGRSEHFPALAAELVALPVDLIVALGPAIPALQKATSTIPIVMTGSGDPVAQGLVQSLARPGGNITGLTLQSVDTVGKRLELLDELARPVGPIAVLWDRYNLLQWQAAEAAARQRGWRLVSLEIREAGEIDAAFAAARQARAGALLVFNSGLFDRQAAWLAAAAARARLPAMYGLRSYVDAGGLMSYGPDLVDNWRRAAAFVDKILKGAKPGDLPVEQPTKFELVINLASAKALGLTLPPSLLLRADEVIE